MTPFTFFASQFIHSISSLCKRFSPLIQYRIVHLECPNLHIERGNFLILELKSNHYLKPHLVHWGSVGARLWLDSIFPREEDDKRELEEEGRIGNLSIFAIHSSIDISSPRLAGGLFSDSSSVSSPPVTNCITDHIDAAGNTVLYRTPSSPILSTHQPVRKRCSQPVSVPSFPSCIPYCDGDNCEGEHARDPCNGLNWKEKQM